jgi:predicted RNase H-like HicB family nuclease
MARSVQCLAVQRDGGWEALCLDYDLAVQGASFGEVRELLEGAIHAYLEAIEELPSHDRSRLLARRAPLAVRLGLAWLVVRSILWRGRGDRQHHQFTLAAT